MRRGLTFMAVLVALAGPAAAGPRDFVIQHAGVGGDTQQAAPYIKKFLEYAEQALGWPAGSATGDFFPEADADFKKYLETKKPGLGLIDPEQFLELKKKENLTIIGTVVGTNQSMGHFNLLAKDPALKALPDLKGKKVVSNHVASEASKKYLSKIVFEGKIDASKHFGAITPVASMLKAVKAVDRGEADVALLSDDEVAALKKMSYPEVKVIWTSPALPPMPVVAFGKNATPKDRDAFAKMLLGMCADPKGTAVCKALDITEFKPADKAAYDAAAKRWDK
jgi:ABC-type phosphate/phosphonate transport system substrate-binding protein